MSIAVWLSLLVGLPVFLAVLVVLGISTIGGFSATLSLFAQRTELMLNVAEDKVRSHLDPAADLVASLAGRIEGNPGLRASEERLTDLFAGALAGIGDSADLIALIRPDGRVLAVRLVDGRAAAVRLEVDPEGMHFLRQRYLAGIVDAPFWDEVRVLPLSGVTLNVQMAVRGEDGRFAGIVVVTAPVRALSAFMRQMEAAVEGDRVYLLAADGTVVAHALLALPSENPEEEPAPVAVDDLGDPVLARLDERQPESIPYFDELDLSKITVGEIDFDVLERQIVGYGPAPLTLGVYTERTGPPDEIQRIVISALLGALVLVISVVIGVLLARRAAGQFRLLAGNADAIGALEFARVRPLPPSGVAEFDDQARAFNAMMTSLRWFETYVPRRLVRRLASAGDETTLQSRERELTILFSDIAGFTTLSEQTPATEVAALLNEHFEGLATAIEGEGGTIDKFLGDGLMAFWGAPAEDPDHALNACRGAAAIATAVTASNAARRQRGEAPMAVRVGLHTGRVVVGNIGAPGRMNYTVVGDPVNVANRLEQAGKHVAVVPPGGASLPLPGDGNGSDIEVVVLISGATIAAANAALARRGETGGAVLPSLPVSSLGPTLLQGRQAGMEVFRLLVGDAANWLNTCRAAEAAVEAENRELDGDAQKTA